MKTLLNQCTPIISGIVLMFFGATTEVGEIFCGIGVVFFAFIGALKLFNKQ